MRIEFTGSTSQDFNMFMDAFEGITLGNDFNYTSLDNSTTGIHTSFTTSPNDITGIEMTGPGGAQLSLSEMSWSQASFRAAVNAQDPLEFVSLYNTGPITIDLTANTGPVSIFDNRILTFHALTASLSILGGLHGANDTLIGSSGNDSIRPGDGSGPDLYGTLGVDVFDLSNIREGGLPKFDYHNVDEAVAVLVSNGSGEATISGTSFTDRVIGFLSRGAVGRFAFFATEHDDSFDVALGAGGWFHLVGGAGTDSYVLTLNGEGGRLDFGDGIRTDPDQALEIDLSTGIVGNDGFGNTERITIRGGDGRLVISGTNFADRMTGSARDEEFETRAGNDTIDGGGGIDTIVYRWPGYGAVRVDLSNPANGVAQGSYNGISFTQKLISIENILGSGLDDSLIGGPGHNVLRGNDGDDTLLGGPGSDTLTGDAGNDSLIGGLGPDTLDGGAGDDTLDASRGDRTTERSGDFILPGTGANTILGNRDLWLAGNGIDINYPDVTGSGGLVVTQGADGAGQVVSNVAGVVDDTYTYGHLVLGTPDGDLFIGAATDSGQTALWTGYKGDDTIQGGAGTDYLRLEAGAAGTPGVTVVFTAPGSGTAQDAYGGTDTFTGIEGVLTGGGDNAITGSVAAERFQTRGGADTLDGGGGNDTLEGGAANDTLIGGDGDDMLYGFRADDLNLYYPGDGLPDLADVIYGGDGNDSIDGGAGNDELRGDAGNDSIEGGAGVDTVIGGAGNDVLTGSAWSDLIFGGDGFDFVNGGFGFDRVNGGNGADKFFHVGVLGHGSDWIQDYDAAEGDVLLFGGGAASASDFLVQRAATANAGDAGVDEVFVTYIPGNQILWALVDGDAQTSLNVQAGGAVFDLLA